MKIYDTTSLDWEEWRDIPWYEWYYQVSNMWRVKSLARIINSKDWRKWRSVIDLIRKPLTHLWYKSIPLSKFWIYKIHKVHRLVASAFLWLDLYSNLPHKYVVCVCHKDDNPSNNNVNNLFLWTHMDNMQDKINKWRMPKWITHHSAKPISQFTKLWEFITHWWSLTEASNSLWIDHRDISKCCYWKIKSAWWYKWKFK